jgi:hypothetical protein
MRERNPQWKDEYEYIEDDELPVLMLGILVDSEYPETYSAKESKVLHWQKIVHQTAGYACHHRYIEGIILPVTPAVNDYMRLIESRYVETQISQPASLGAVVNYQAELVRTFGETVKCDSTHYLLEEAFYPIDATPEALKTLTTAKLPSDLDDLIQWESDFEQLCGIIGRWGLFILGQNSD